MMSAWLDPHKKLCCSLTFVVYRHYTQDRR